MCILQELSDLDPIARNTAELAAQQDQVTTTEGLLAEQEAELQAVLAAWDDALAAGTVTQSQWASNRATAEDVTKVHRFCTFFFCFWLLSTVLCWWHSGQSPTYFAGLSIARTATLFFRLRNK